MEPRADVNFWGLLRQLLRHWPIIAGCVTAGIIIGGVYFSMADRVYESSVVVHPARDAEDSLRDISSLTSQLGAVASIAGLAPSRGSRYDQSVALLTSQGFFEVFDERTAFRKAVLDQSGRGVFGQLRDQELMTIGQAHASFHGNHFRLIEDPTTSVVWLRMRSWDPNLSSQWVNQLVAAVNEVARVTDLALSERMLTYLEQELEKTQRVETKQAISALIQREIDRKMLANVTKDYAFTVIDAGRPSDLSDFVAPSLGVSIILGAALGLLAGSALIVFRQ